MKPTPEAQGTLAGIHTRLLSRPQDPVTSKAAARELVRSGRLTKQQEVTLWILREYGPGTTHEIASRYVQAWPKANADFIHHQLARRFPELESLWAARVQQDRTKPCRCKPEARECHCQDVVREGCRVWEATRD